jgi:hypothetical protein
MLHAPAVVQALSSPGHEHTRCRHLHPRTHVCGTNFPYLPVENSKWPRSQRGLSLPSPWYMIPWTSGRIEERENKRTRIVK